MFVVIWTRIGVVFWRRFPPKRVKSRASEGTTTQNTPPVSLKRGSVTWPVRGWEMTGLGRRHNCGRGLIIPIMDQFLAIVVWGGGRVHDLNSPSTPNSDYDLRKEISLRSRQQ